MTQMIQAPDLPNIDRNTVNCFGWARENFSAGQFVILTCADSGRSYFSQVTAPQYNFNRDALGPLDNQTINALEALEEHRFQRTMVVNEVFYYTVRLLKDITDGTPKSVRQRPHIASVGRAAIESEVIAYLGLPAANESFRLGSIVDTDIAVCLDQRVLLHHLLIAGSTGSGKSNTIANAIKAAVKLNVCVVVYDHKPDYQNLQEYNDEGDEDYYEGLQNVSYWYLGGRSWQPDEQEIIVPASELDPSVLAATIFHAPSEYNQAEVFDTLLWMFSDVSTGSWSLDQFRHWLPPTAAQCAQRLGVQVNTQTYDAIRQKISRRGRIPNWIDGQFSSSTREFFKPSPFELQKLVRPGQVIVIRIDSSAGNGRAYGLLLSYVLKEAYNLREHGDCDCPILHIIDEAQDIFNAGTSFQRAAGSMLDENIRKGRSKRIGFVIGVQSADAVPENIRNNLNTQIIHRHNNHTQAKEAMTRATPEQIAMTDTFGPGESLVYLYGANAVMQCQMRRAPFKLTKDGD